MKPNFFAELNTLRNRVSALERIVNTSHLRDINTIGLTSAQIDVAIFGGQQPYDGAQATDAVNSLILAREGGKWRKATLTIIP